MSCDGSWYWAPSIHSLGYHEGGGPFPSRDEAISVGRKSDAGRQLNLFTPPKIVVACGSTEVKDACWDRIEEVAL